jgi:hypothetical protein
VQRPLVAKIHIHEWGDVECLALAKLESRRVARSVSLPEDINMAFEPRSVGDFRYNRIDRDARGIEAIIEVQRAEVISPVA